jgi:SAM-dependent methyltransferase
VIDPETKTRMRDDWNQRAREDANYYVAFGRREQEDDEFFATAREVLAGIHWEMRRLDPAVWPRARRALEVGCGPGRLMKPLAADFGEIHGVDVSDEMIRLAREKLAGVAHAHAHSTDGADLRAFADSSFDLVYSYAVFQHIPSRDVVLNYFAEMDRVLKPGGIIRCQVNGLPQSVPHYDTWSGVRFTADDLREFTRAHKLQLLALEGINTQYMWTTWRKPPVNAGPALDTVAPPRLRRITNTHSSEPVAQTRGRYAAVTLWMEDLPTACDLNELAVTVGGQATIATYIGPRTVDGSQQLNILIPGGGITGLLPLEVLWRGAPLIPRPSVRVIPAGPLVPRVISVSDGINLLSGTRVVSGVMKAVIEDVPTPELFAATVDGAPVRELNRFCTDPRPPSYEFTFRLPEGIGRGAHTVQLAFGRRQLPPVAIEVA